MIRPLRQRHRFVTSVLAVVVPILFVLALRARLPVPSDPQAAALLPPVPEGRLVREWAWPAVPVLTRLLATEEGEVLVTAATEDLRRPDLLLYAARGPAGGPELPATATLRGELVGTDPYIMPAAGPDWLILYSLGHREVVATLRLEERP